MTNRDCALLGFKLVGIWLISTGVIGLANLPYFWQDNRFEEIRRISIAFTALPSLVAVTIGVFVWSGAESLAGRVFPEGSAEPAMGNRLRAEPLFALALSVIGIVLIADALPLVVNGVALFVQSRHAGSAVLGPDIEQRRLIWGAAAKANVVAAFARLVLGLGLMAGPARLSATYARVRSELRGSLVEAEEGNTRKVEGSSGKDGLEGADAADEQAPRPGA